MVNIKDPKSRRKMPQRGRIEKEEKACNA